VFFVFTGLMIMSMRTLALSVAAALVLTACGSGADQASVESGVVAEKAVSQQNLGINSPVSKAPDVVPGQGFVSKPIPDRYIVVFRSDVNDPKGLSEQLMNGSGGQTHFVYSHALRGFAATIPAQALRGIAKNPQVESIEPDVTVSIMETQNPTPSWGLDRVDQRDLPLNRTYTYGTTGIGVYAFVIDTGIRSTHTEFYGSSGSRVIKGFSAFRKGGTEDCNGHGTHVAGTIGGASMGIARDVTLVPVRVLDCNGSGSMSGVIAGVDYVAGSSFRPAVANMSLGGGAYSTLDNAVNAAVASGVTMVVAAGNDNSNACNYSPARATNAITVGATTSSDARASYSNYGSCLDIFAPGSGINSAWIRSNTDTNTISGTSMATPHVAGVAALIASVNPTFGPSQITTQLLNDASPDKVTDALGGSPNKLLFASPDLEAPPPPPPPPPPPSIDVDVTLDGSRTTTRRGWTATVAITVKNTANPEPVSGATVSGGFTSGGSAVSCVTGSTGSCTVKTSTLKTSVSSTTYTVRSISASNPSINSVSGRQSITVNYNGTTSTN
jgi:subtilisin family serine protease